MNEDDLKSPCGCEWRPLGGMWCAFSALLTYLVTKVFPWSGLEFVWMAPCHLDKQELHSDRLRVYWFNCRTTVFFVFFCGIGSCRLHALVTMCSVSLSLFYTCELDSQAALF